MAKKSEEEGSEEEILEEKELEAEEAEGEKTEEEIISEAGNDQEEAAETGTESDPEEEKEEETGKDLEDVTEAEAESNSEEKQEAEAGSNPEDETEAEAGEDSEKAPEAGTLTFEGPDYTVSVTYTEDAGIPEGASLVVSEIREGSDEYNTYRTQAEDAIAAGGLSWIRLFDISIEVDGKPIEPDAPVAVQINYKEAIAQEQNTEVNTVHFEGKKETPKLLDTEVEGTENTTEQVSFETDGFSVFAIVGTVIEKTVLASDGHNYKVTVTCEADSGIPEGAELKVKEILPIENSGFDDEIGYSATDSNGSGEPSVYDKIYDEYVAYTEYALGMEEGSAGYIRLFDIKIVDKDDYSKRYQPKEGTTVDVRIELEDKDASEEAVVSTQVVHFADGSKKGDVVDAVTDGQIVIFEASGFSIFAIAGDGVNRLIYKFYDGSTLVSTQYIKKYVTGFDGEEYVYSYETLHDPGVLGTLNDDEIFIGWAEDPNETDDSKIYTLTELNNKARETLDEGNFEDEETKSYYAIIREAYFLQYLITDDDGNIGLVEYGE